MTDEEVRLAGARRAVVLGALSVGGFAIGCNEFIAMGVLPEVAREFDPSGYALDPSGAVASDSVFVWAYALGVVIGAPVLGLLSSRFRRGRFLTTSIAAMALATVVVALAPRFGVLVGARLLTGIPHAAFLGVAALVAAEMLGRAHAARGVALVIGGLTVANLLGAPAGTWLGQHYGWRVSYVIIAAIFVIVMSALGWSLGAGMRPAERPGVAASLRALVNGRLWAHIVVYALVNSGLFAVATFTAPIVTALTGFSAGAVPVALVCTGIGMTLGNYLGGALADRSRVWAELTAAAFACTGLLALMFSTVVPLLLFVGFVLVGYALGGFTPFVQVALTRSVPTHPQLGSSMNSLSANAGSVFGSITASIAVASVGIAATVWVGIGLTVTGLVFASVLSSRLRSHAIQGEDLC